MHFLPQTAWSKFDNSFNKILIFPPPLHNDIGTMPGSDVIQQNGMGYPDKVDTTLLD